MSKAFKHGFTSRAAKKTAMYNAHSGFASPVSGSSPGNVAGCGPFGGKTRNSSKYAEYPHCWSIAAIPARNVSFNGNAAFHLSANLATGTSSVSGILLISPSQTAIPFTSNDVLSCRSSIALEINGAYIPPYDDAVTNT